MRGYLAEPTRSQIRDACIYLFNRRKEKYDDYILNRFFQFKSDENKLREIQNFGDGRFRSIEKFLKGEVKKTSTKNINLISWLIDFHPRPYEEYSKSENSNFVQKITKQDTGAETPPKKPFTISEQPPPPLEKKKRRRLIITISIAFGATLLTIFALNNPFYDSNSPPYENQCMAWADTVYIKVDCDMQPFSEFGTKVEPLDASRLNNLKKVEVNMATTFFAEDGKPMIWYSKNKEGVIEFFTAPGLHPITGETLKKITPYIIETYVPVHIQQSDSFLKE